MIDTEKYQPARQNMKFVTGSLRSLGSKLISVFRGKNNIIQNMQQYAHLEFDDSGQLSTKIYDKRDDFNFKIINFPNLCSNIPFFVTH
jgi:hypothetical protein